MLSTLLNIPHLDLGLEFDVNKMLEDISVIDNFRPYQSSYEQSKELYKKHWSGASLISVDGSVFGDMEELKVYPNEEPKRTVLADKCLYLMEVLKSLNCDKERSRVMRIGPQGHLDWHSHVLHHKQNKERLVVQIPIYVPEGFTYSVVHAQELSNLRKGEKVKTYNMEYQVGRAYVFNSFHPHNVFNPTDEHRITLMTYMNYNKNKEILEKAISNYSGPFISCDL